MLEGAGMTGRGSAVETMGALDITEVDQTGPGPGWPWRGEPVDVRSSLALLDFYGPLSPIRVISGLGSSPTVPGIRGEVAFYDLDHLVRSLMGVKSVDLGLSALVRAGGKGADVPSALQSILGEAFERLLGVLFWFEVATRAQLGTAGSLASAGFRVLGPERLHTFAPEQLAESWSPYEPFTEDSHLAWIEGRELLSGEPTLVPAQVVPLLYSWFPQEARLVPTNSGGLAAGPTRSAAVFRAVMELFERDALNLMWFAHVPAFELDPESVFQDPIIRRHLRGFEDALDGAVFRVCRHDVAGIHTVSVLRYDQRWDRYAWSVGGAASTDPRHAMCSAVSEFLECEHTLDLVRRMPDSGLSHLLDEFQDPGPDAGPEQITSFFGALLYYGHRSRGALLGPMLAAEGSVRLEDLDSRPADLESLRPILTEHGIDPVIVPIEWEGLPQIGTAPCVVRALCPDLTPPNTPDMPMLGHPRYAELPHRLGVADRSLAFDDLQQLPMPFA